MRTMCEFKNKFDGRNDRDTIDAYRYGECRKPEVIRLILDTVPVGRVPFMWCWEKVTVRIEGLMWPSLTSWRGLGVSSE